MQKIVMVALGLAFCSPLYAQKSTIKFGDVPAEALNMKYYEYDSTASAVILGDYGVSTLSYSESLGLTMTFERTTRIKIFKKEGFEWADFEIPLYSSGGTDEKLVSLKAQTTNLENGKPVEVKVKGESIFKDKANDNLRNVKITFPNVKEGSVLDITYKVSSEFFTNLDDWQFQHSIPTVVSEYKANIPEWFTYDRYMQGYVTLTASDHEVANQSVSVGGSSSAIHFKENRYRWRAEHVPAFHAEPYITTEKDYLSRINFDLASLQFPMEPIKRFLGNWADVNKTFSEDENFLAEVTGNSFLKKTAEELTVGLTTDEQKIAVLHSYVKSNFSWDGSYRKLTRMPLKKTVEAKKGSSADLNLLLASLLNKAGIEVYPTLISTRDNGFVRQHIPNYHQFNSVVCLVKNGDKTQWLDATDPLLPVGILPLSCLNGQGFVVSKNGYSWVPLSSPVKAKTFAKADFTIDANGMLTGQLAVDRTGYSALSMRTQYLGKGEEDYVKEFSSGKVWQINKTEIKNVKEINEPVKEVYEMSLDGHADAAGDVIYLNPFLLMREETNPFKLETRMYPVNFGTLLERGYTGKFVVPDGYVVDEFPQNKILLLPNNAAKYMFNASVLGNQVIISSILQINRDSFSQDDYPNLREFYNQVVAKQSEQIVLKKKQ